MRARVAGGQQRGELGTAFGKLLRISAYIRETRACNPAHVRKRSAPEPSRSVSNYKNVLPLTWAQSASSKSPHRGPTCPPTPSTPPLLSSQCAGLRHGHGPLSTHFPSQTRHPWHSPGASASGRQQGVVAMSLGHREEAEGWGSQHTLGCSGPRGPLHPSARSHLELRPGLWN